MSAKAMRIYVSIKPNAKTKRVDKINESHFKVWVKESPVDGKANLALIKALAGYFDIAPSRVEIISGHFLKKKVVEII